MDGQGKVIIRLGGAGTVLYRQSIQRPVHLRRDMPRQASRGNVRSSPQWRGLNFNKENSNAENYEEEN